MISERYKYVLIMNSKGDINHGKRDYSSKF